MKPVIRSAFVGTVLCGVLAFSAQAGPLSSIRGVQAGTPVPPAARGIVPAPVDAAIESQYIVAFNRRMPSLSAAVDAALARVGGEVLGELPIIHAAVMRLDGLSARLLAASPFVRYVEQDQWMRANGVQSGATWGLDRVDQAERPLDGQFAFADTAGAGVEVYVVDTGIRRSHDEFAGRVGGGRNFVADSPVSGLPIPLLGPLLGGLLGAGGEVDPSNFEDCNGHGTHVSATATGTTFGVAKAAEIFGVRVLGCDGSGPTSAVISGLNWVADNHGPTAVANLSLGGGNSQALDDAVRALVADDVVVVVAAGNNNRDACTGSPNRVREALTVGATDSEDRRSNFSNFGECVDVFAPGSAITSAWHTGDEAVQVLSGTSMAGPHVAGAAALLLGEGTAAEDVFAAIVNGATTGVLAGVGAQSPDRLLRTLGDTPD